MSGGCNVLKDDRSGFRMNDFWLGRETDEVIKVKHLGEKGFILSNRSISSTRSPSLSLSFPVCVSSPLPVSAHASESCLSIFIRRNERKHRRER